MKQAPWKILKVVVRITKKSLGYSHSIVPGGFDVMSYTTLFTLLTLLQILDETSLRKAPSKGYQSAVMPSALQTALRAIT